MTKLLIIEDDNDIRSNLMDWFQFEGYEVFGAPNGRVGLEAVLDQRPDLILCDILMPELDGYDVLIGVRAAGDVSNTPFIFITAASDRESMRKGMTLGADDYLTKPFTRMEILNAVRARLEKRSVESALIQHQIDLMQHLLLEEHERSQLKSRLVALFSHDFRNPLASIQSASNIIRNYEDRLTPERKQQYLDRIDGSVQQLTQMLEDMLMVAEVESGHLRYVPGALDITPFVEGIVADFRLIDFGSHTLDFRSSVRGHVEADRRLLRHIISNLLSNALKYSPAASTVRVTLDAPDGTLRLAVADEGIGIPEVCLPRLFEPFYRADNALRFNGTGLGLSIVHESITRHGGGVEVASAEGSGSTFVVTLPLKRV